MTIKLSMAAACMGVACVSLSACATVKPWERGHFARAQMALAPHPLLDASRQHNYSSREGAVAGGSAEGGGCGCY